MNLLIRVAKMDNLHPENVFTFVQVLFDDKSFHPGK